MLPRAPGRAFRAAAVLLFAGLAAASARAQVRPINVTQQNTEFSPTSTSGTFGESWNSSLPNIDQSVNGQRIIMGMYDTKMSPFNGQQGPYDWRTAFPQSRTLDLKMMDQPETNEPDMAPINGQQASLSHYTNYSEWQHPSASPKFSDTWVLHTGIADSSSQPSGKELSLQDINRYEFRASRSSEPGLPVTHAGTGGDATTAGTLVNTPALFDFGDGSLQSAPTSQVHSGGMVAPQMISPSGEIKSLEPSHPDVSEAPAPTNAVQTPETLANPTLNSPELQEPGHNATTQVEDLKDGTRVISTSRVLD
jgi:hypothetical protein